LEGGDTISAAEMVKTQDDSRDASFVRYQSLVDKYTCQRHWTPEYKLKTFFPQQQYAVVVPLPMITLLTLVQPAVKTCVLEGVNTLGVPYYSKLGPLKVVDIICIQCAVGRVKYGQRWAIIDRSGTLARAVYTL
ncbi:hypothetical protein SERLA73DRAFT_44315, partial [Serpula lacrymans var. lacrymans S7.3]